MSEPVNFSKDSFPEDEPGPGLVRQQSWHVDGPAELELATDVGRVRVHLEDLPEGGGELRVEVRHDPSAGNTWTQGLSGLINWLGSAAGGITAGIAGDLAGNTEQLAADAVSAAEISWSESGRRLVVRSSQELPLRVVPLAITVWAPTRSRLAARVGAGDVRVTGRAGWAGVRTGSGNATLDGVDGDADVTTGSGAIDLGPVTGRARLRTGSGAVRAAATGGPAEIKTGSGDIVLGEVNGDVRLRTGSGDITVSDARSGALQIATGSGSVRIGVHPGVGAELDLVSGSGKARSELDVAAVAPEKPAAVQVRGRTGSGDVLVARAAVPA
jgi:Putative adhesin